MINKIECFYSSSSSPFSSSSFFFLKSKKTSPDRSDLFIAESHESVNRASAVLQECLQRKPD